MSKIFTLITLFTLFPFLSTVFAQTIPSYPDVWDPAYPMNRCVDFCAFLRPGQICPAERYNPNCLCSVYNIRMPACEQCWRSKNATVADKLQLVLTFCAAYNSSSSAASGSGASGSTAMASTTAPAPAPAAGGGSTTSITTSHAISTGSPTTTVTFNSGAGSNKAYDIGLTTGVMLVLGFAAFLL